ncbi:MAG: prolyl oligopeptidase family serine peptidase [Phycisphaerales bacterium]
MMRTLLGLLTALAIGCAIAAAHGAPPAAPSTVPRLPAVRERGPDHDITRDLTHRTYRVEGAVRDAVLWIPPKDKIPATGAPVVFVFHGHGGSAFNASRQFALHTLWPEALIVYPQGLPTVAPLVDPQGKERGWQLTIGSNDDRDLKFFDAMLAALDKECPIDRSRIYCTGHSNGGGFTYLLWQARPDVFAAVAPSAAAAMRPAETLKPLPVMHMAGEKDPLVRYEWQVKTMDAVQKLNGCNPTGTPWAEHATIHESRTGTPLVRYVHPGGHEFVKDAAPLIVRFFKEHAKPATSAPAGDAAAPGLSPGQGR